MNSVETCFELESKENEIVITENCISDCSQVIRNLIEILIASPYNTAAHRSLKRQRGLRRIFYRYLAMQAV